MLMRQTVSKYVNIRKRILCFERLKNLKQYVQCGPNFIFNIICIFIYIVLYCIDQVQFDYQIHKPENTGFNMIEFVFHLKEVQRQIVQGWYKNCHQGPKFPSTYHLWGHSPCSGFQGGCWSQPLHMFFKHAVLGREKKSVFPPCKGDFLPVPSTTFASTLIVWCWLPCCKRGC